MSIYDDYRNRVGSIGSSIANAFQNSTVQFTNQTFTDSPYYFNVPVDGVNTDVRIVKSDESDSKRIIMFRPNAQVYKGAVVQYNGSNWLMMSFNENTNLPQGNLDRCNEYLRWKDQNGQSHSVPMFGEVNTRKLEFEGNRAVITDGISDMYIYAPYNSDSQSIKMGMRFVLGSNVYVIMGSDDVTTVYNGHGTIFYTARLDTVRPEDDMANKIADNSHYYKTANTSSGGKVTWK